MHCISPIASFAMTGHWFGEMPLLTWYPFDEHDPRFYNFVLVWQWCYIFVIHVTFLAQDLFLYSFITLISMHFNNLCKRLRDLKKANRPESEAKLIEVIKIHQTLIRLSGDLEKIFAVSIFFNFFESSIYLCLFGYQISIGSSLENTLKNIVLVLISLLQIFLVCYYGSKLTNAGKEVVEAAYDLEWYGEAFKDGRSVILMMQRAQKPNVLTAWKFSVVSLEVYSSVSLIVCPYLDKD